MIRWIIVGPVHELETKTRTNFVARTALTISQNILYGFRSNRQVTYKPSQDSVVFRQQQAKENPQVLGLALTVHHDTQSLKKNRMGLLNKQGFCVSYGRTVLLKNSSCKCCGRKHKTLSRHVCTPFPEEGNICMLCC